MSFPPLRLTRAQVRQIDRIAMDRYHIPGIVLMENAARGAAEVAWHMLGQNPQSKVQIVCGGGNNGGDGLAIARHLHNLGLEVVVVLAIDPGNYSGDALINWRIVEAMKIPVLEKVDAATALKSAAADLTIDSLFGTGLERPPRHDAASLIALMNLRQEPILSIDLPSGLDCDTGLPLGGDCVRARLTVTFAAEKAGFANLASRQYTGDVKVAHIGCPRELLLVAR